ncbi:hypothetical protein ACLOJK_011882 [Asimina triloba]
MVADLALGSSGAAAKMAPHGSMIFVQLSSAAYAVLTRVILTQGISSTVFLFYQFAIATIFMAALAFIFERYCTGVTLRLCNFSLSKNKASAHQIHLMLDFSTRLHWNLLSACLYYISSSLEAAVINLNPVFTFILSIMFRQEELAIHTPWGKGKVFGTILSVSGALTLMLWKDSASSASSLTSSSLLEWVLGLVMVLLGVLALSTWILLLGPMTRRYPAQISLTAIMFFFGMLQTAILAGVTSPKASEWKINMDLEIANVLFGGVFCCGVASLFITWCAGVKGPIFVASFAPLGLVFTTILEMAFLGDSLYYGSIVGAIMVVVGLYIYLWSKAKEEAAYIWIEGDEEINSSLIV